MFSLVPLKILFGTNVCFTHSLSSAFEGKKGGRKGRREGGKEGREGEREGGREGGRDEVRKGDRRE